MPAVNPTDAELQRAIDAIAPPGIAIGHRLIAEGDDEALLPEEMQAFAASVIQVRRASAAARIVARQLMSRFGRAPQAIRKSPAGVPMWPDGIVGSLAHDNCLAIAALAERAQFPSIGVDVEPAEPLSPDLLSIISTSGERSHGRVDLYYGRLLFAIKEAVYKAVYPLDGRFLEPHDVEVSLSEGVAQVRDGRSVYFSFCAMTHFVVLAHTT